jgi:ribonuclease T1
VKWNRQTIKAVVLVFLTVILTSFFIKWTFDHDGETVTLFGDDSPSQTADADRPDPESGLAWVLEGELPVEGQATLALIDQGGPFPYEQDGSTFGNFEGLLPDRGGDYYREYTVITPGSTDRGARRIIAGDGKEFYWTEDHYESFSRIYRRTT